MDVLAAGQEQRQLQQREQPLRRNILRISSASTLALLGGCVLVCASACGIWDLAFGALIGWRSRFVGKVQECEKQDGMCTISDCMCNEGLLKRKLVTNTGDVCWQCVQEFCPIAVEENASGCSSSSCQCHDYSWLRINVGADSEPPCWQCRPPAMDVTLRLDSSSSGGCLAPMRGGNSDHQQLLRLSPQRNDCAVFRYNGATFVDKRSEDRCLAWHHFGNFWGFAECHPSVGISPSGRFSYVFLNMTDPHSISESISWPSALNDSAQAKDDSDEMQHAVTFSETYCLGPRCVDVGEKFCTTDEGRCTEYTCSCEDPTWHRQELFTLDRKPCFACAAPVATCTSSPTACTPDACECLEAGYERVEVTQVAVAVARAPLSSKSHTSLPNKCFRCRRVDSRPFLKNLLYGGFCVMSGLAVGLCVPRLFSFLSTANVGAGGQARTSIRKRRRASASPTGAQESYPLRRMLSWASSALQQSRDAFNDLMQDLREFLLVLRSGIFSMLMVSASEEEQPHSGEVGDEVEVSADLSCDAVGNMTCHCASLDAAGSAAASSHKIPSVEALGVSEKQKVNALVETILAGCKEKPDRVQPSSKPPIIPRASDPPTSANSAGNMTSAQRRALRQLTLRREKAAAAAAASAAASSAAPCAEAEQTPEPADDSWIDSLEREEASSRSDVRSKPRNEIGKGGAASKVGKKKKATIRAAAAKGTTSASSSSKRQSPRSSGDQVACAAQLPMDAEPEPQQKSNRSDAAAGQRFRDRPAMTEEEASTVGSERAAPSTLESTKDASEGTELVRGVTPMDDISVLTDECVREQDASAADIVCGEVAQDVNSSSPCNVGVIPGEITHGTITSAGGDIYSTSHDIDPGSVTDAGVGAVTADMDRAGRSLACDEDPNGESAVCHEERDIGSPSAALGCVAEHEVHDASQATEPTAGFECEVASDACDDSCAAGQVYVDTPPKLGKWGDLDFDDHEDFPPEPKEAASGQSAGSMNVNAPEFIPFSMLQHLSIRSEDMVEGRRQEGAESQCDKLHGAADVCAERPGATNVNVEKTAADDPLLATLTTVVIIGIPLDRDSDAFRMQLDLWGLTGTYNLFYMPRGVAGIGRRAVIDFVDPRYVAVCVWLFQDSPDEGIVTIAQKQGMDETLAWCTQMVASCGDVKGPAPVVMPAPTPSRWAQLAAQSLMIGSQLVVYVTQAQAGEPPARGQYLKTKMCGYFKKRLCKFGADCPFAHSRDELQPQLDLTKTRLCNNFLRGRCAETTCKFAHGYHELRSTDSFYKTEMCRWYEAGHCRAGSRCRFAHCSDELRGSASSVLGRSDGIENVLAIVPRDTVWGFVGVGAGNAPAHPCLWPTLVPSGAGVEDVGSADDATADSAGTKPGSSASASTGDDKPTDQRLNLHSIDLGQTAFRQKHTFLEIDNSDAQGSSSPRRRSYSCGDLEALAEAWASEHAALEEEIPEMDQDEL